ncbi:MAG: NAD-dependent epimerase/dehydratase family protein [Solirubrobacterales bacterium]|nr:NAD-dependent epimerase/dehydratase family protein [Solirubrobacterales bacterium]
MDLGLADRIAVVAGGGGALGSATVRMLVSEGAQVVAATDDTTKPLPGLDDAVRRVKLDLAMAERSGSPHCQSHRPSRSG